jgi:hypothetical protein
MLVALCAAHIAAAAERTFDKRFAATSGGTLTVDTDFGAISVTGTEAREVVVHATISGTQSQVDDFEMTADSDSNGVSVRGKRQGDWWLDLSWFVGHNIQAKYEIQVPKEYHLEMRTSGGGIEASNINGNVRGRTSGGQLRFNSMTGVIDAHSSGGSIEGQQISGRAQLRTSGGSITITDAAAELDVRTSGGSIRLQNVDGKVTAHTSGGSIEASFKGANRGVDLSTSGGGIRVGLPNDFKASVDAHSSGGSVSCDLPQTSSNRDDSPNSLKADLNGGGPMLRTRTSGGSIRIRALH